jgi:tRNA-Thr(GGU) m(6)t(6)A37 methyltransferase TsaA
MNITFKPIGIIHSPFKDPVSMPVQPTSQASRPGHIEMYPTFADGLKDLAGFSHIILLYYFHKIRNSSLSVIPFLDSQPRGVFATRAPTRPNPIGLSVVKLVQIEGLILRVADLDVLDGTPLLDIKPYIPAVDHRPVTKTGWLEQVKADFNEQVSDDRFR